MRVFSKISKPLFVIFDECYPGLVCSHYVRIEGERHIRLMYADKIQELYRYCSLRAPDHFRSKGRDKMGNK